MAVLKVNKVIIIAHSSLKQQLISYLKDLGVLELESKPVEWKNQELKEIEKGLEKLNWILNFAKEKFKRIDQYPPQDIQTAKNIINTFDIDEMYNRCLLASQKHDEIKKKLNTAKEIRASLMPWKEYYLNFDIDFSRLKVLFCGIGEKEYEFFHTKLKQNFKNSLIIWESKFHRKTKLFTVAVFKNEMENFLKFLKDENVKIYDVSAFKGRPIDILEESLKTLELNQIELDNLFFTLKDIKNDMWKVKMVYDHYLDLQEIILTEMSLAKTKDSIILEGWVLKKDLKILKTKLLNLTNKIHIILREPLISEEPPVILTNHPLIKPFEFITELYGKPNYWEPDPTPILSPFFTVFFALCISDVFYGLILSAFCLFILTKYHIADEGAKLLKMLIICGLFVFLGGVITDSCAGFELSKNFSLFKELVIFNPLKNPMQLLILSFVLGIFHIVSGLVIKFIKEIKKDLLKAFGDFIWVPTILSVAPLVYKYIFGMKISENIINFSKDIFIICIGFIILFSIITTRNILLKPFSWIVRVYSIVGYFGDVLSYARILTLCLAGIAISQTVNYIVNSVYNTPYIGPFIGILIFIFGHTFNFLMNCLGAFVHSARLQYVEFFQKFFESGGRDFKSFKRNLVTVVI